MKLSHAGSTDGYASAAKMRPAFGFGPATIRGPFGGFADAKDGQQPDCESASTKRQVIGLGGITTKHDCQCRGVAQPGSASALGAEGRGFKSLRPDHFLISSQRLIVVENESLATFSPTQSRLTL